MSPISPALFATRRATVLSFPGAQSPAHRRPSRPRSIKLQNEPTATPSRHSHHDKLQNEPTCQSDSIPPLTLRNTPLRTLPLRDLRDPRDLRGSLSAHDNGDDKSPNELTPPPSIPTHPLSPPDSNVRS